jgi:hypothetical protein
MTRTSFPSQVFSMHGLVFSVPDLPFQGQVRRGTLLHGSSGWAQGGIVAPGKSNPDGLLRLLAEVLTERLQNALDTSQGTPLPRLRADALWDNGALLRPETATPFQECPGIALGIPGLPPISLFLFAKTTLLSAHGLLGFYQTLPEDILLTPPSLHLLP